MVSPTVVLVTVTWLRPVGPTDPRFAGTGSAALPPPSLTLTPATSPPGLLLQHRHLASGGGQIQAAWSDDDEIRIRRNDLGGVRLLRRRRATALDPASAPAVRQMRQCERRAAAQRGGARLDPSDVFTQFAVSGACQGPYSRTAAVVSYLGGLTGQTPPAMWIICGVQCPPGNSGEVHSRKTT
jgi:hypothetical protein